MMHTSVAIILSLFKLSTSLTGVLSSIYLLYCFLPFYSAYFISLILLNIPIFTYTVSGGTLNPTHSLSHLFLFCQFLDLTVVLVTLLMIYLSFLTCCSSLAARNDGLMFY